MQKFLKFQLNECDRALLPAVSVKEAISLPLTEILPVPGVSECVMGICNWRGEIIWAIDLAHLFGYPPIISPIITAAIAQKREYTLALVVPAVNEIVERDVNSLQYNVQEIFPEPQSLYLEGYFVEPEANCLCSIDLNALIAQLFNLNYQYDCQPSRSRSRTSSPN
jgi:chemotaxis signal transduction protein